MEIYNASLGSWAPVLRVIYFISFDRPETVRDRAKMNLAGHRVRRLFGNYFEPCDAASDIQKTKRKMKNTKTVLEKRKQKKPSEEGGGLKCLIGRSTFSR